MCKREARIKENTGVRSQEPEEKNRIVAQGFSPDKQHRAKMYLVRISPKGLSYS